MCINSKPRNMKKRLLACALIMTSISTALVAQGFGQRNINPEEMAQRETDAMKDSLSLSEAQVVKVHEVNLKYAARTKEMRESMDGDFSSMREKFMAMRTEKQEELKIYLTEEQFATWEKIQLQRREGRGRGDRKRGKKPNRTTPNQKA